MRVFNTFIGKSRQPVNRKVLRVVVRLRLATKWGLFVGVRAGPSKLELASEDYPFSSVSRARSPCISRGQRASLFASRAAKGSERDALVSILGHSLCLTECSTVRWPDTALPRTSTMFSSFFSVPS